VAGLGNGLGIFFNTHTWMPLLTTLYMFAFYLIMLQHAVAALLALVITVVPSLIMCFFGQAGQWWELFRWNFLIGWSLINLVANIIPTKRSQYIRDENSWNVTNLPVQEQPHYISADNSTTVLGYSALSTTLSCAATLALLFITILEFSHRRISSEKPPSKLPVQKDNMDESTSLLSSANSSTSSSSMKQRSVKYTKYLG